MKANKVSLFEQWVVLSFTGKITSLDTSLLRASMKPGWEDLVRRCIQRFHLQNDGEVSYAKKHQQDGETLRFLTCLRFPSAAASDTSWCWEVSRLSVSAQCWGTATRSAPSTGSHSLTVLSSPLTPRANWFAPPPPTSHSFTCRCTSCRGTSSCVFSVCFLWALHFMSSLLLMLYFGIIDYY